MDISSLAELSKPLARLSEVIASGVGAVSKSYLTRRDADAEAYAIETISQALMNAAEKQGIPVIFKGHGIEAWGNPEDRSLDLTETSHERRAAKRIDYRERKRQNNIERITSGAAVELSTDTDIPDASPDEDWITRFFNFAQDVSSGQMQKLWARIVAGEIRRPGSYSLKTLDFVRNLTKQDAELMELLAPLTVKIGGRYVVPIPDKIWLQKNRSVYDGHHFAAGELGSLYPTDMDNRFFYETGQSQAVIICSDRLLLIDKYEVQKELKLPVWPYTRAGSEIIDLISPEPDIEHLKVVGQFFSNRKARVRIGRVVEEFENGGVRYADMQEIKNSDNVV